MGLLNPVNKSWCLEQLCEANYRNLLNLIPHLISVEHSAIGVSPNHSKLYLTVLEHTPYTKTIQLSHRFQKHTELLTAPAVVIRLYTDLQLAEVLSDHARVSVKAAIKDKGLSKEIMNYKWRLNYFLHKWLDHCLKKSYQFNSPSLATA